MGDTIFPTFVVAVVCADTNLRICCVQNYCVQGGVRILHEVLKDVVMCDFRHNLQEV